METPLISKRQFNRIRKYWPVRKNVRSLDDRMVISAIILVTKYGLPWCHIPEFYGKWTSIHSRFRRWSKAGVIANIFYMLTLKLPKRCVDMIDSTFVKAQRSASSMRSDGQPGQLGRSRGGITTKIHLLCNSRSQPMDFIITGWQVHDVKIAPVLTAGNKMKHLLADRAYDSNSFRDQLKNQRVKACIPLKSNRKKQESHDHGQYRLRHVIENMFAKLKDLKGIVFRANRCAHTFYFFVALALIFIFL